MIHSGIFDCRGILESCLELTCYLVHRFDHFTIIQLRIVTIQSRLFKHRRFEVANL